MDKQDLNKLRFELSTKAKNGIDFILSASITWFCLSYVWTLPYSSYDKSVLTFIFGGLMIPLALLLSKVLKTNWKVKNNPLQPLGLWLNFAQLFYFPFLIFILLKHPDYFVMGYAIITGAHFLPYAWFYNEKAYAVASGIISIGALLISLNISVEKMYYIPIFMGITLFMLAIWLYISYKRKIK